MSKFRVNYHRLFLLMVGTILLLALLSNYLVSTGSDDQFAVTLIYFEGDKRDSEVHLRWATATEIDTVGFMLERSLYTSGPFQLLTDIGFIPSLAEDGFSGAEYQRIDRASINSNQTYYYVLVEIEVDGSENRTDPIAVSANQVDPTATSQDFVATSQPTATFNPAESTGTSTPGTRSSASTGTPLPAGTMSTTPKANPIPDRGQTAKADESVSSVSVTQPAVDSEALLAITPTFEGYPALEEPGRRSLQGNGESYPGPTAVLGFPPPASGHPVASPSSEIPGERLTDQSAVTIGGSLDSDDARASFDERETLSAASTLILWLGFIAAVAIFVAAIVGSIYWFSNRRIRSR